MLAANSTHHHQQLNYTKVLKLLRRRARLTGDLVKITNFYFSKANSENNSPRLKTAFQRASSFIEHQIRLIDKEVNLLFSGTTYPV